MERVHTAIGVTCIVALVLVVTRKVGQVGGMVLAESRAPISDLVTRGGPVADQLTAVEGETPLVEGDRMDGACSVVQKVGGKVCALVGPLLPRLGSDRNSGDSTKEEGQDKQEKAPEKEAKPEPEAPPAPDPPEEEAAE
ncbi:uncharacterized protein LOC108095094 [Drosophila ficusphila]|uniref:uncharacterized protein LOC108095094 n=1 Tax=Drosophila ficusphila TaxID=30025 RepID=UPI0007E78950|nr:uncharacterized protein LOC108095094 [Drosophila ficusphila]